LNRNVVLLAIGSILAASCTAILGDVPTGPSSGGAGPGGGATSMTTPGGGGAGGTTSQSGGGGTIGHGGGATVGSGGGVMNCQNLDQACGGMLSCCQGLTCDSVSMKCVQPSQTCTHCGSFMGATQDLCAASYAKFEALKSCACTSQTCIQVCSIPCGGLGGPDDACIACMNMACLPQYKTCADDQGCNSCNDTMIDGDVDKMDACSGSSRDALTNFLNCVCGNMLGCDGCAGYCMGSGFDSTCTSCLMTSSACSTQYNVCKMN
jgi:hypothetical protein